MKLFVVDIVPVPIALSDGATLQPYFTDFALGETRSLVGGNDFNPHVGTRLAAADDGAGLVRRVILIDRRGAAECQVFAIDMEPREDGSRTPTGDQQSRFGQTITGDEGIRPESCEGEMSVKSIERFHCNRLGTTKRDVPMSQVESGGLVRRDSIQA